VQKGHLTLGLTNNSTTIVLTFAPILFYLSQMPIGMETYRFQASSVTFGPNSDAGLLSPLYDIVASLNLFYRICQAKAY